MTEKGCGNCYYSFFDERAYPCSLCIRGIERTDKWQPSKKTKADRKTEPQNDCEGCKHYVYQLGCTHHANCEYEPKTEPQTERVETMSCQECKHYKVGKPCKPFLNECDCHYEPRTENE